MRSFWEEIVGVEQTSLQHETGPHLREHVSWLIRLDIHAEARPDAEIERALNRWNAVAHLHLYRYGQGYLAPAVGDQLKFEVTQRTRMDVGRVVSKLDAIGKLRKKPGCAGG